MKKIFYKEWGIESPKYWLILAVLAAVAGVGGLAALYMEHNGHWVSGMNNQIVWGTPHVFAIFLIVAASGALNVASIGSVFGQKMYKPLARLSGLLAVTLLVGGLLVLVLDLGQPSRLIVAMTTYNFKSIFAWNIYLYVGFIAIVGVYLFTMMERKANSYSKGVGVLAFVWRLALTTGTGSIFGFLVARQGYDAAIGSTYGFAAPIYQEVRRAFEGRIPLGRYGDPDEPVHENLPLVSIPVPAEATWAASRWSVPPLLRPSLTSTTSVTWCPRWAARWQATSRGW